MPSQAWGMDRHAVPDGADTDSDRDAVSQLPRTAAGRRWCGTVQGAGRKRDDALYTCSRCACFQKRRPTRVTIPYRTKLFASSTSWAEHYVCSTCDYSHEEAKPSGAQMNLGIMGVT